jgi:HlyD family secretion protein
MRILRKTRGWKLPMIGAIAMVFALNFVLSRPEAADKIPAVSPPQSSYGSTVAGIGVIEPRSEIIALGVELPGVVRQVPVAVGDSVKKGTPLLILDQREIEAQIRTLEAARLSARVAASDASAQFATLAALKDKKAVAKDEFNRRRHAKELAEARVKEAEAQLEQARTTKERLSIKAPIDAAILEINIRPGEYAAAGVLSEPLMRLGDVSTLHVRVEIDEENAARVRADAPAKALRRGDTTHEIPLRFVRFEPFVSPKQNLAVSGQRVDTRVLQILYAIEMDASPNAPLFVGQQMDVFIDAGFNTETPDASTPASSAAE